MKRVGIVGAGWWADFAHIPAFRDAGAEIVGLYSRGRERAQKLADAQGIQVFESYEDLLSGSDIVAVSTTDDTHAPLGLQAIRAGKHLFIDKPLALTAAEAQSLVEAAHTHKVLGLTSFTSRGDLAAATARRRIQEGVIGEVLYIRGFFHGPFMSDPATPTPWRCKTDIGGAGGAVADLGAHLFDLTRMVTGLEFSQVLALSSIHFQRPDPVTNYDEGTVLARLGSATGSFSLSRVHAGSSQLLELEVQGSKGALKVRPALWGTGKDARLWLSERPGDYLEVSPDPDLLQGRNPDWQWGHFQFVDMARNFIKAIEGKPAVYPSLEDGLATQQVIEAATLSSSENLWVKVG